MRSRVTTPMLLTAFAALGLGFYVERGRESHRLERLRSQLERERIARWRGLMEEPMLNWGPSPRRPGRQIYRVDPASAGRVAAVPPSREEDPRAPGSRSSVSERCQWLAERARADAEEAIARARFFEEQARDAARADSSRSRGGPNSHRKRQPSRGLSASRPASHHRVASRRRRKARAPRATSALPHRPSTRSGQHRTGRGPEGDPPISAGGR